MKARRSWANIQTLREHKFQPRLLFPAKLSITIDEENRIFHDKTKFTQYLSTNPALQRIIRGKHQYKEENCAASALIVSVWHSAEWRQKKMPLRAKQIPYSMEAIIFSFGIYSNLFYFW